MSTKRIYPLFIIDSSRTHGRGHETDYISCTSSKLPFVASVTFFERKEYVELYDPSDNTTVWSNERNGIRMRIKVVSNLPTDYDRSNLTGLLRRALKEMLVRRKSQMVDIGNITDDDIIMWCTLIHSQVSANLRECPENNQDKMNLAILTKILNDYHNK